MTLTLVSSDPRTAPDIPVPRCPAGLRPSWAAAQVFAAALRGESCRVIGMDDEVVVLPAWKWLGQIDSGDSQLLDRCVGPTVDIGCGPGRMTNALLARGVQTLGIDVVAEAVELTRARGGVALQRDVFTALPGEGRWQTALLADGNIGIGGDPVRLLQRTARLLRADGRIVVDLSPPGGDVRVHRISLEVSAPDRAVSPGRSCPPTGLRASPKQRRCEFPKWSSTTAAGSLPFTEAS